jgi:predicted RNA binding protein YcfA (HicA-like mRNA interferase family)
VAKQKRLSAREVVRILAAHSFELVSQKGSHQKWKNYVTGKQVIVALHKGKELPLGTLKAIIEGSGLEPDAWK